MRAHVWTRNGMHQSAIVLVRCVPGSSLLPPPYWKARRPWGRGCPVHSMGAFHLVKFSGISGSAVHGTLFVGSFHWKIPWKSGKSKKAGPYFQKEFRVPFTRPRSLYQSQVHGKKICHGQLTKQNGFPRALSCINARFVFFASLQWRHLVPRVPWPWINW